MSLTEDKKREFEKKIRSLNEKFDEESFKEFFQSLAMYRYTTLTFDIENWLYGLIEKEKLPLVWGILAWWYFMIGETDASTENALKATRYFPDTDLWQTFIDAAYWLEKAGHEAGEKKI
ncbi:MAG: hypothetical protein A2Y82_02265 [Candidatus Buchananbacteria bacterium RBG_13_36_9]|uniref:Uncharacterized protein n=1 Tax=Candidatus Buchananbacteria bacterium RBG_13_36_9 TaxID=1797530 RepID=A0A1G1XNR5_9BACT|nr:MAG: hypothetical protein A2Y82_02265 [Candidatus Buchananbacteria bacterium RBG_13_36_9]